MSCLILLLLNCFSFLTKCGSSFVFVCWYLLFLNMFVECWSFYCNVYLFFYSTLMFYIRTSHLFVSTFLIFNPFVSARPSLPMTHSRLLPPFSDHPSARANHYTNSLVICFAWTKLVIPYCPLFVVLQDILQGVLQSQIPWWIIRRDN